MTIFSKIIKGEVDAEKVFENERILAIKDNQPVAPVHLLIISKKEIPNLQALDMEEDGPLLLEMVGVAKKLAEEFGIRNDYRFLTNNGEGAGQTVFHLHFHLIGGTQLGGLVN